MENGGMIDAARTIRNETARAMDAIGYSGQGEEMGRRGISEALLRAAYSAHTIERLTDRYVKALRRAQDLNEQLYEAAGNLADAGGEINRHLTSRNASRIL